MLAGFLSEPPDWPERSVPSPAAAALRSDSICCFSASERGRLRGDGRRPQSLPRSTGSEVSGFYSVLCFLSAGGRAFPPSTPQPGAAVPPSTSPRHKQQQELITSGNKDQPLNCDCSDDNSGVNERRAEAQGASFQILFLLPSSDSRSVCSPSTACKRQATCSQPSECDQTTQLWKNNNWTTKSTRRLKSGN